MTGICIEKKRDELEIAKMAKNCVDFGCLDPMHRMECLLREVGRERGEEILGAWRGWVGVGGILECMERWIDLGFEMGS